MMRHHLSQITMPSIIFFATLAPLLSWSAAERMGLETELEQKTSRHVPTEEASTEKRQALIKLKDWKRLLSQRYLESIGATLPEMILNLTRLNVRSESWAKDFVDMLSSKLKSDPEEDFSREEFIRLHKEVKEVFKKIYLDLADKVDAISVN